jgi:hypothetical protein
VAEAFSSIRARPILLILTRKLGLFIALWEASTTFGFYLKISTYVI